MATLKEMLVEVQTDQKKQSKLLTEIDICLRGPNYDKDSGGLVDECHNNTECIKAIKKKQNKIVTWGLAIFGTFNLIAVIIVIINALSGKGG